MRLIFDQNISYKILRLISDNKFYATTVKDEGLTNATDKEIWEYAKRNNLIIVTQDADFSDLNSLYGFPPKIIWIRTGNLRTKAISEILNNYYKEIKSFVNDDSYGCFEIINVKKSSK